MQRRTSRWSENEVSNVRPRGELVRGFRIVSIHLSLFLAAAIGFVLLVAPTSFAAEPKAEQVTSAAKASVIQVYKTPTCGCCTKWIDHLRAEGFEVKATDLRSLDQLKAMNGVPQDLAACHTGLVGGYVIERHVPASDIRRLLAEKPDVSGLAVPGMPMGSPGMEHPDPHRHEAFDGMSFGADGVKKFSRHTP